MASKKILQRTRSTVLLISILLAFSIFAQEAEEVAPRETPNLIVLQTDWWFFFQGTREEVEPRVEPFFAGVESQLADLEPQNEEIAATILVAVRDYVAAYLALLDDPKLDPLELKPAAFEYGIDDLLRLSAEARKADATAREELLEVEREERTLTGTSRRRDTAFDDYVGAAAGDERRLTALRLMRARSAQALSERRLELLTQRYERVGAFANATSERVEVAKERLSASVNPADLDELQKLVDAEENNVGNAAEASRAAQLAASCHRAAAAQLPIWPLVTMATSRPRRSSMASSESPAWRSTPRQPSSIRKTSKPSSRASMAVYLTQ